MENFKKSLWDNWDKYCQLQEQRWNNIEKIMKVLKDEQEYLLYLYGPRKGIIDNLLWQELWTQNDK